MSEDDFKAKLAGMTTTEIEVLWDRVVLVVDEVKRRGLLAPKSDDLFNKHLIEATAEGVKIGRREAVDRLEWAVARVRECGKSGAVLSLGLCRSLDDCDRFVAETRGE